MEVKYKDKFGREHRLLHTAFGFQGIKTIVSTSETCYILLSKNLNPKTDNGSHTVVYVGSTKRELPVRIQEHIMDPKKRFKSKYPSDILYTTGVSNFLLADSKKRTMIGYEEMLYFLFVPSFANESSMMNAKEGGRKNGYSDQVDFDAILGMLANTKAL